MPANSRGRLRHQPSLQPSPAPSTMPAPAFHPPISSAAPPRPSAPSVCRRHLLSLAVAAAAQHCLPLPSRASEADPSRRDDGFVRAESGLEVRDYRVGAGRPVAQGDVVVVKWTGRLADRYGWPIQRDDAGEVVVRLSGGTDMIRGFFEGLVGDGAAVSAMCEGGKRRLVVPKELGYIREGQEPLPADYGDRRRLYSTVLNKRRFVSAGDLVFDVELKKIKKKAQL